MTENIPLGFDGISGDEGHGSPTDYTVQFTPSSQVEHVVEDGSGSKQDPGQLEEVGLLETRKETSPEEKVCMLFDREHYPFLGVAHQVRVSLHTLFNC